MLSGVALPKASYWHMPLSLLLIQRIYILGVISRADQASVATGGIAYTIAHEIGHFLSLYHVWNSNGQEVEGTTCGDDEVDDTPPTRGHFSCGNTQLYDTVCSSGYFKEYDSADYYHITRLTGNIESNRVVTTGSATSFPDSITIVGQSFIPDTTDFLQNITVRVGADSRSGDVTSMSLYTIGGALVGTSTNTQTITPGQILTYNFPTTIQLVANSSYKFVINRVSGGIGLFSFDVNDSNKYAGGTLYRGTTANTSVSSSDLYFAVKATVRNVAANLTSNKTVWNNSTLTGGPSIIGQTITVGTAGVAIRSIKLIFSTTSLAGDSVALGIYDAAGSLVATSDGHRVIAGDATTFAFQLPVLTAYKTYKFVINKVKGAGVFSVQLNNTNPYSGGVMYSGPNAATPVPGSDLYFDIAITRLRRFDYPDTNNTQNIMDYSSCNSEMFTKGQIARMRATLRSDVGNRYKLISDANLARTGVLDTVTGNFITPPDITPTALFTVNRNFTCQGSGPITFTNRSYNDTIASATWNFDKGADVPTSSTIANATPTFNDTGWVTATLIVSGNNTPGSSTYTRKDLVYVASPNGITPYVEEFNPGNQLGKFPVFNYFDNPNYRWELYNAGVFDFTSIRFKNYDIRDKASVLNGLALNTAPQSPRGLFADFYTPAYNLDVAPFDNKCFLSFFSAGAFRTNKPNEMNDSLLISYSTNCGQTWSTLGKLKYGDLANNGYRDDQFVPQYNEWKEQSFAVPFSARSANTYFRFRYFPGTDNAYLRFGGLDFGTGNNFYLDRLAVTANPLGVVNGVIVKLGMSVQPNPTSGAATIRLNGGDNSIAEVNVTDVTGKLVFHTSAVRKATTTEIEIPASAIAAKGMYLVHVVTNGATQTQKLVAY